MGGGPEASGTAVPVPTQTSSKKSLPMRARGPKATTREALIYEGVRRASALGSEALITRRREQTSLRQDLSDYSWRGSKDLSTSAPSEPICTRELLTAHVRDCNHVRPIGSATRIGVCEMHRDRVQSLTVMGLLVAV